MSSYNLFYVLSCQYNRILCKHWPKSVWRDNKHKATFSDLPLGKSELSHSGWGDIYRQRLQLYHLVKLHAQLLFALFPGLHQPLSQFAVASCLAGEGRALNFRICESCALGCSMRCSNANADCGCGLIAGTCRFQVCDVFPTCSWLISFSNLHPLFRLLGKERLDLHHLAALAGAFGILEIPKILVACIHATPVLKEGRPGRAVRPGRLEACLIAAERMQASRLLDQPAARWRD